MNTKRVKNIAFIVSIAIYSYLLFIGNNRYMYSISYGKSILFILLLSLLFYSYGILENKEETYKRNVLMYIFLYFVLLVSVTFFIGRMDIHFSKWQLWGQYEPFYTIKNQLHYGSKISVLKNVIGNSLMLMPLSFLLMIKNKKYKNILRQTLIILPTIICVECLQPITNTGVFDIDDILLNYLGAILFTFIITRFSIMDHIRKLFYTDFKSKEKGRYCFFYFITCILLGYSIYLFL